MLPCFSTWSLFLNHTTAFTHLLLMSKMSPLSKRLPNPLSDDRDFSGLGCPSVSFWCWDVFSVIWSLSFDSAEGYQTGKRYYASGTCIRHGNDLMAMAWFNGNKTCTIAQVWIWSHIVTDLSMSTALLVLLSFGIMQNSIWSHLWLPLPFVSAPSSFLSLFFFPLCYISLPGICSAFSSYQSSHYSQAY